MPSRRSHTNSHHGCIQCKEKRVKCDQSQPKCSRCNKKGQTCTYRHLMSSYDPFREYKVVTPASSSKPKPKPKSNSAPPERHINQTQVEPAAFETQMPSPAPSTITALSSSPPPATYSPHAFTSPFSPPMMTPNIYSMPFTGLPAFDPTTEELLHHYTTQLSPAFLLGDTEAELLPHFHDAVVRHCLSSPYLYHAVLSFSNLHIASASHVLDYTPPSNSPHVVAALGYKATALDALRPVLECVTPATCEPALAATGLLTACTFALPHGGATTDTIDCLAQIASLYQGAAGIMRLARRERELAFTSTIPKVRKCVTAAAVREKPWAPAEAAVDHVILSILELEETSESARTHKSTLMDAAFKLKTALRRVAGQRGVYSVACMWLAMVRRGFSEYVRGRDPLSLVLLAHWAICLRDVKHIWWVGGWAQWTIDAVWRATGSQYLHLMAWVLDELKDGGNHHNVIVVAGGGGGGDGGSSSSPGLVSGTVSDELGLGHHHAGMVHIECS